MAHCLIGLVCGLGILYIISFVTLIIQKRTLRRKIIECVNNYINDNNVVIGKYLKRWPFALAIGVEIVSLAIFVICDITLGLLLTNVEYLLIGIAYVLYSIFVSSIIFALTSKKIILSEGVIQYSGQEITWSKVKSVSCKNRAFEVDEKFSSKDFFVALILLFRGPTKMDINCDIVLHMEDGTNVVLKTVYNTIESYKIIKSIINKKS